MTQLSMRFALLHHVLSDTEHWDLCLEAGETLATWQLLDDPLRAAPTPSEWGCRARRIADHRKLYLDYEGPVSHDRGHVRRIDRGSYTLVARRDDGWVVRLSGTILIGTYELVAGENPDNLWRFQRLEA